MTRRLEWVWSGLGLLGLVLGLVVCLWPLPPSSLPHGSDKWVHAAGMLSYGVWWSLLPRWRGWPLVLGLAGYGALIELLQGMLTTTRSADLNDWYADMMGVVLAAVLVRLWRDMVRGAAY